MIYQVLDDDDHALDAHLEIEGKDIVFHSRGGTKGKDAQNADYSRAFACSCSASATPNWGWRLYGLRQKAMLV